MRKLLLALLVLPVALDAQQQTPFELSVSNIMRGPEHVGREPTDVRWTPDGRWIYFRWNEPGTDWREAPRPFRVRPTAGARPERVTLMHMDSVGALLAAAAETGSRAQRAVTYNGDLFLVDVRSNTARRLTRTREAETQPQLDVTGSQVFFVRGSNAYAVQLGTGEVRQITNIRTDTVAEPRRPDPRRELLEAQQLELIEAIRDRARLDSIAEAERARRDSIYAGPLTLARGESVASMSVSPSGRAVIIITESRAQRARQTEVPQYVTRTGYAEVLRVRDKVGDEQPFRRVGVMRLPSGETTWLMVTPDDTTRPTRSVNVLGWNERGTGVLVTVRSADNKTRWVHVVDEAGVITTVDVQRDTAWVGNKSYDNTAATGTAGWFAGG
ncbi:MAG: DPP IV N-terminal domain-containing protein, partial [Gemmatimonadaceae bacterium]|nr:DPP IV N-terminal domain-containing protein [Gemmatimonadaceae bacterium]